MVPQRRVAHPVPPRVRVGQPGHAEHPGPPFRPARARRPVVQRGHHGLAHPAGLRPGRCCHRVAAHLGKPRRPQRLLVPPIRPRPVEAIGAPRRPLEVDGVELGHQVQLALGPVQPGLEVGRPVRTRRRRACLQDRPRLAPAGLLLQPSHLGQGRLDRLPPLCSGRGPATRRWSRPPRPPQARGPQPASAGRRRTHFQPRSSRPARRARIGSRGQPVPQVGGQLAGAGVAPPRVLFQTFQADRLQVAGDLVVELSRRPGLLAAHLEQEHHHGAAEGRVLQQSIS